MVLEAARNELDSGTLEGIRRARLTRRKDLVIGANDLAIHGAVPAYCVLSDVPAWLGWSGHQPSYRMSLHDRVCSPLLTCAPERYPAGLESPVDSPTG
jgi:hypothetical protein